MNENIGNLMKKLDMPERWLVAMAVACLEEKYKANPENFKLEFGTIGYENAKSFGIDKNPMGELKR